MFVFFFFYAIQLYMYVHVTWCCRTVSSGHSAEWYGAGLLGAAWTRTESQ